MVQRPKRPGLKLGLIDPNLGLVLLCPGAAQDAHVQAEDVARLESITLGIQEEPG